MGGSFKNVFHRLVEFIDSTPWYWKCVTQVLFLNALTNSLKRRADRKYKGGEERWVSS